MSAIPLASLTTLSEELGVALAASLFILGFLWFGMALIAAAYGWSKGYPFFPLLLAGILMPVYGSGLVLVAVAIAGERLDKPHT